ncbi:hypothetical protein GCM10010344_00250 [Streptomyces bluensis]|nr:hypothetical protein GCM10010344_00250 [Streptomyces bluensis]
MQRFWTLAISVMFRASFSWSTVTSERPMWRTPEVGGTAGRHEHARGRTCVPDLGRDDHAVGVGVERVGDGRAEHGEPDDGYEAMRTLLRRRTLTRGSSA